MILTQTVSYKGRTVKYDDLKPNSKIKLLASCPDCGIEFYTSKYQLTRNGHELCRPCAISMKLSKTIPIGTRFGRLTVKESLKSGRSLCLCDCGASTEVVNRYLLAGHTKSCGCLKSDIAREHAKKYLSKYQRSAHPNWKGGIAPLRDCISCTTVYKEWRRKVFEAHEATCQKCGTLDDVQVHHIHNFVDYPALRLKVDNGTCLCKTCHGNFHKRYGLKKTNQAQLSEFLSC